MITFKYLELAWTILHSMNMQKKFLFLIANKQKLITLFIKE